MSYDRRLILLYRLYYLHDASNRPEYRRILSLDSRHPPPEVSFYKGQFLINLDQIINYYFQLFS